MSGGGRKERAANSLEEERSRWLFVVTVVHACPEYLRAGDGLNYFHVPLRVNDRTIDDKSQIRSIPLPFNFSLSNSRGEKSDRFRLRATTRETAIRVLGKKTNSSAREMVSKPFADFTASLRIVAASSNELSFFSGDTWNSLHATLLRNRKRRNGIVPGLIFASIVGCFRRSSFYRTPRRFSLSSKEYRYNNNTTRFEIDDLKKLFQTEVVLDSFGKSLGSKISIF